MYDGTQIMREQDIRKLLLASRTEQYQVDPKMVPRWDYAYLSRVAVYCSDSGLVRAAEVTNMQSPHREFIVQGISALGEDWLEARSSAKWIGGHALLGWKAIASILAALSAAVGLWQFPTFRTAVISFMARIRHCLRGASG